MRLVHVTDPHLTSLDNAPFRALRGKRLLGYLSWYCVRRRRYRKEVLDRLTGALAHEHPDYIVVSGDLVHIGLPGEIEAARAWLDELASMSRVFLVPGNHDLYAADSWTAVAAHWHDYLGFERGAKLDHHAPFPIIREIGDVAIIGLSSACPMPAFFAAGRLGVRQRAAVEKALETYRVRGMFRCVVVHHPPLPGMTARRRSLLDDAALEALLRRAGAEMVLHGHMHEDRERVTGDNVRIFGTASASSKKARDPASFRVFDIMRAAEGWNVRMRLKVLDGKGAFADARTVAWGARHGLPERKTAAG
jgi:3',5'-cyclic AMP phosphodiesterase CpdA